MSTSLSQATSPATLSALTGDELNRLTELLKRCRPETLAAILAYHETRKPEHLSVFVLGVLERFVERDLREKLHPPDDALRLVEDLSLDSLTLMEIVLLVEDALDFSVSNDQLVRLKTVGDIRRFVLEKAVAPTP